MNDFIELGTNTGASRQKQKLLLMRKILLEKTDENNALTGNEIIEILAMNGIKEERKTLYDDIATLNASGLAIEVTKKGHANAYYVSERLFTTEELFVLADAVASSKFLTQKKSSELIKKLQKLTSDAKSKSLRRQIFVENRAKTFNENIYYTINQINEAIFNKKMITFQYFSYDTGRKKQLRHGGEVYKVSPYYLLWKNDNYYLICHSPKRDKIVNFRADRMTRVTAVDEKRAELSIDQQEIAKSLRQTFDMYTGTPENVTFEIDRSLIDVMVDRFGEKIILTQFAEDTFRFNAEVQISPTFWGWLFTFGKNARVCSPKWVVDMARDESKKLFEIYK